MPWGLPQPTKMAKNPKHDCFILLYPWGRPSPNLPPVKSTDPLLLPIPRFSFRKLHEHYINSSAEISNLIFIVDHNMHQGIILRKPIQGIILMKPVCLKFCSAKADLFKTTSCWQICFPAGNIRDKMKTLKCFLGKRNPSGFPKFYW